MSDRIALTKAVACFVAILLAQLILYLTTGNAEIPAAALGAGAVYLAASSP